MDDTQFSIPALGLWTGSLDLVGLAEAAALVVEVEQLGYGALWIPEVAGRDVMLSLGAYLAATEHMVGATGIASIWARDAVTMVGGVKGLTAAFPERMLLGLGVSHHTLVEGLRGHRYEHPLAAMATYLTDMDGSPYTAQRPSTPVRRVLAALGPKMLALAAEKTEGAHSYFVTPEHTAFARAQIGDALLCVEQAVLVETDATRARAVGRAHTATYVKLPNYQASLRRQGFDDTDFADGGSQRLVDGIVAWGDEDAVRARVQAHFDAGADHVCVQPITADLRQVPSSAWRALAPVLADIVRTRPPRPPRPQGDRVTG